MLRLLSTDMVVVLLTTLQYPCHSDRFNCTQVNHCAWEMCRLIFRLTVRMHFDTDLYMTSRSTERLQYLIRIHDPTIRPVFCTMHYRGAVVVYEDYSEYLIKWEDLLIINGRLSHVREHTFYYYPERLPSGVTPLPEETSIYQLTH